MGEFFLGKKVELHCGNCLDILPTLDENSIDACVTDPPYHLTSIVKRFGGDMPPRTEATVGKHAYGRHATGFMGRTWDGGDVAFRPETWAKVLRVLKPGGYILAFASTRGFARMSVALEDSGFTVHPFVAWIFGSGFPKATRVKAQGYEGYRYGGQALKPAIEPIFMGQKPFEKGLSGTQNILKWGTGALNIDGCRVPVSDTDQRDIGREINRNVRIDDDGYGMNRNGAEVVTVVKPEGRWPANVIHDGSEEVLAAFPDAPGQQRYVGPEHDDRPTMGIYGDFGPRPPNEPRDDGGSAARFFYTAKADADDRVGSKHPTVKPLDLKQYLIRMITPPGGVVLDLFAGTGTTGEAAWREGMRAVLIEREAEYQNDIRRRMALCLAGPDERARESLKAAGKAQTIENLPLFGK